MSLTDLMSGAGLQGYAIVALLLFFAAFLMLAGWIYWPTHRRWWNEAAQLPLNDTTTTTQEPK